MKEDFSDEDGIRASELEAEFADMDGWNAESDAATLLNGLGIPTEDHYTQMADLPGAAKVKVLLAQALFGNPDILLLDEPTSHLDTYSQLALEQAIEKYEGAVLMVSHDFYTVANCMDYVLFVEEKKLRKMSIRKFRKMIYADHFDKNYLELEQKKKELENRISFALQTGKFEEAGKYCDDLEQIINQM